MGVCSTVPVEAKGIKTEACSKSNRYRISIIPTSFIQRDQTCFTQLAQAKHTHTQTHAQARKFRLPCLAHAPCSFNVHPLRSDHDHHGMVNGQLLSIQDAFASPSAYK